jgi:hypothetical protein
VKSVAKAGGKHAKNKATTRVLVPKIVQRLTGIRQHQVDGAPGFADVWRQFTEYIITRKLARVSSLGENQDTAKIDVWLVAHNGVSKNSRQYVLIVVLRNYRFILIAGPVRFSSSVSRAS